MGSAKRGKAPREGAEVAARVAARVAEVRFIVERHVWGLTWKLYVC